MESPSFVNPQDIAISTDGTAFVTDLGDFKPPDRSGVYVLRSDGSRITRIGRYRNYDGQFLVAHGVAVGKDGEASDGEPG